MASWPQAIRSAHGSLQPGRVLLAAGRLAGGSINRSPTAYAANPQEERDMWVHGGEEEGEAEEKGEEGAGRRGRKGPAREERDMWVRAGGDGGGGGGSPRRRRGSSAPNLLSTLVRDDI